MTIAVDLGGKATKQIKKYMNLEGYLEKYSNSEGFLEKYLNLEGFIEKSLKLNML